MELYWSKVVNTPRFLLCLYRNIEVKSVNSEKKLIFFSLYIKQLKNILKKVEKK